MPPEAQACPICGTGVTPSPRYPDYLCRSCADRATAPDGRRLTFHNVAVSGGFEARHADDGALYDSHDCVVDGVACRADEAHMGGIVVRPRSGVAKA